MIYLSESAYDIFCELNSTLARARIEVAVKALDTACKRGEKRVAAAAAAAEDDDEQNNVEE